MQPVLAFDFGGTKLAAGIVDIQSGKVLGLMRCPTPVDGGAPACLEAMVAAGEQALGDAGLPRDALTAIGISFGGPISRDRRRVLRSMHVPAWEALSLPELLEQRFAIPAFMDNDANAAALGEWLFGAGQGQEHLLYVQISTGIGSGLILNGRIYRGAGLAGEFGHTPILPDGPLCSCGQRGCLESLASGWALAREARRLLAAGSSPLLTRLAGEAPAQVSAELLLHAAEQGDAAAGAAARQAFSYLAQALAQAVCLLDPETVILGGGVTRARGFLESVLFDSVSANLTAILRNRVSIRFSALDGLETLIGAACLARGI